MDSYSSKVVNSLPIQDSKAGRHILSQKDVEYIHSFAVDGIISFSDYIKAVTILLNGGIK